MSNEAADQRPPSPPHSNDGDFGFGVSKNERYQEPFTPPRTVRPGSRADVTYGAYGSPSQYPPIPQQVYYTPQPVHYHTPPNVPDPGIMTRSGKTLGSPIESRYPQGGDSRSPKPRRNKTSKFGKKGLPAIDQPLSVLTKDYKVPVRDMGAWVSRSVEERMKEVEKKKGYVSRPMNSFMLYRSAYAERVKQFCKENNHQVVSQVTGQSWPMEPPTVREMYEQYAVMERDNHAAAHPTYKFAPNKSGKKRGRNDGDDSDSDDDWRGPGSTKRSRMGARGDSRSMTSTPFDPDQTNRLNMPVYHQPHPSSYQAHNPHGPPPFSLGPAGLSSGYYQPQMVPYAQHVDDIKFGRIDNAFAQHDPASQLIGMPDGNGSELMNVPEASLVGLDQMLDPRLAQFDPHYSYDHFDSVSEQTFQTPRGYTFGNYSIAADPGHVVEQIHPGMATLTEGWSDDAQAGLDFDNEFRQWS